MTGPDLPSRLLSGEPYRHNIRPLYENVKELYLKHPYSDNAYCKKHKRETFKDALQGLTRFPNNATTDVLDDVYSDIFVEDQLYVPDFTEIDWTTAPSEFSQKYIHEPQLEIELDNIKTLSFRLYAASKIIESFIKDFITQYAPDSVFSDAVPDSITVPLITLINNPRRFMTDVLARFAFDKYDGDHATFPKLSKQLLNNTYRASGKTEEQIEKSDNPDVIANPMKFEASLTETAYTFFNGTPLLALLTRPVPFVIPEHIRSEHTHILGGSGHGKSTLLCQQFLSDISKKDSPALIIIDGKGTFVSELQRFKVFEPGSALSDRLIILNPQDAAFPPALNMFVPPNRQGTYPEEISRQIENSAIELFQYIFSARDFKVTAKQATCLSYCVRLLFSFIPTANIHTLLDLLSDKTDKNGGLPANSPFKSFIEAQPAIVRRYFTDLYYHPTEYGETKRQLQNRIFDLLENPAFAAMFSTTERKLDLFDIIQNRKILLVNSSPSALGEKGAPLLGRYIIALALSSAYGRLSVPKSQWHPAYLIVDEAQMFVDEDKTQPLLQQAREFNLGVVLAHQKLADLTPTLSATLAGNTSIKFAGGASAQDASFMAKNMHCESEFIMGQRKVGGNTSFACYVRGYTENAISLSVPLGGLDKEPKMTEEAYTRLIKISREKIAVSPIAPTPAAAPVEAAPPPSAPPSSPAPGVKEPKPRDTPNEWGNDY